MGRRPSTQSVADQLAARAMSYAEQQIEGVELAEVDWSEVVKICRSQVSEELAVELLSKHAAQIGTRNMEIITNAIARAFVHGYAAKLDDAKPVEALGGIAEARRRRAKRG